MTKRFKEIGSGCFRIAYESKRTGLILKFPREGSLFDRCGDTENEKEFFYSLKPHERKYFPVVRFIGSVVVMKKCMVLEDIVGYNDACSCCLSQNCTDCHERKGYIFDFNDEEGVRSSLYSICEIHNIPTNSIEPFLKVLEKMDYRDLHLGNIGVLNNHFVLIDAGN